MNSQPKKKSPVSSFFQCFRYIICQTFTKCFQVHWYISPVFSSIFPIRIHTPMPAAFEICQSTTTPRSLMVIVPCQMPNPNFDSLLYCKTLNFLWIWPKSFHHLMLCQGPLIACQKPSQPRSFSWDLSLNSSYSAPYLHFQHLPRFDPQKSVFPGSPAIISDKESSRCMFLRFFGKLGAANVDEIAWHVKILANFKWCWMSLKLAML